MWGHFPPVQLKGIIFETSVAGLCDFGILALFNKEGCGKLFERKLDSDDQ